MAATCPKCLAELPRKVLWKGLKLGILDKIEITCPQCQQVLRITPESQVIILTLAILPQVTINIWLIPFLDLRLYEIVLLVVLVLIPLTFALLIFFYLKLARFEEKPPGYSIRG